MRMQTDTETIPPANIGLLFGQPTQFEAPFFRHAHAAGGAALTVLYVASKRPSLVYDPELKRNIDWGFDLYAGYRCTTLPARGRTSWLWNALRSERYDWLIINGYTTPTYFAALVIARLRGIRTALRIDSVLFNAQGWPRRLMKRVVLAILSRCYTRFFAAGTLTEEYLVHFGVPRARIARFPYVVDVERFGSESRRLKSERAAIRKHYGVPPSAHVILAVAKMNARESPWDLIAALQGLERPDVWTVLIGDGEQLEALRTHVHNLGLPRIVFGGYVPYRELVRCYVMADLFVHAAADEPWGVSVHEAIACGLPVIASSRVGAARDLVLPGRNGYVYTWGDAADLRAKLASLIDVCDSEAVRTANHEVLAQWNYEQSWAAIREACT